MFKIRFVALLSCFCAGVASAQTSQVAVGTLPGDLVVDNTGAANYTIPLNVVPGTAGMEPELSLIYSSRAGDGVMGVGWSVGPVSAISRAPATLVHDGFVDAVDFDEQDRFSLDGERLVETAGVYGADRSEYRTEIDSFRRVVAYRPADYAGRGPKYFKVWNRAGSVMTYGDDADTSDLSSSHIPVNSPEGSVLTWALSRVEDRTGNYMEFAYNLSAGGEHTLKQIRYTGNSTTGLSPYNVIDFEYVERSSVTGDETALPAYLAGSEVTKTALLKRLIMRGLGGVVARSYELSYEKSPSTARIRFVTVQEISGDESLPATQINWTDHESTEVFGDRVTQRLPTDVTSGRLVPMDSNGDGLMGLFHSWSVANPSEPDYPIARADFLQQTTQGWQKQEDVGNLVNSLITEPSYIDSSMPQFGDFDGDGTTDVVFVTKRTRAGGQRAFYLSTRHEVHGRLLRVAKSVPLNVDGPWPGNLDSIDLRYRVVDLNADGRSDVLDIRYDPSTARFEIHQWIFDQQNIGEYFEFFEGMSTLLSMTDPGFTSMDRVRLGFADFTGDGFLDLLMENEGPNGNSHLRIFRSVVESGEIFFDEEPIYDDQTLQGWDPYSGFHLVDLNNDGQQDLIRTYYTNPAQIESEPASGEPNIVVQSEFRMKAILSTGVGLIEHSDRLLTTVNHPSIIYQDSQNAMTGTSIVFANLDGDIRRDLIVKKVTFPDERVGQNIDSFHDAGRDEPNQHALVSFEFSLGESTGFSDFENFSLPSGVRDFLSFDHEADGDLNFGYVREHDGALWYDKFEFGDTVPDLLQSVTNGLGKEVLVEFGTIAERGEDGQASYYVKGSGARYPIVDLQTPMNVVVSVTRDTGLADDPSTPDKDEHASTTRYTYAGGRAHITGRGFLGFQVFESVDVDRDFSTIDILAQDYPTTGMVLERTTWFDLGGEDEELLTRTQNRVFYDSVEGGTLFPFIASSTEESWKFFEGTVTRDDDGTYTVDEEPYSRITTRRRYDGQREHEYTVSPLDSDGFWQSQPLDENGEPILNASIKYAHLTESRVDYGTNDHVRTLNTYDVSTDFIDPSADRWILNRVVRTVKTSTIPADPNTGGVHAESRVTAFTYNPSTGLLVSTILEPEHASLSQSTAQLRDPYGNVFATWVSTPQIPWRMLSWASDPDSTYRFYRTVTNAEGHAVHSTYDSILGTPTSSTDSNGRTTHYEYDAWRRRTRTYNDDVADVRMESTTSYTPDTTQVAIAEGNGSQVRAHIASYKVTTQSTESPTRVIYHDRLGRVIRTQGENFAGEWVNRDSSYNSNGQLTHTSEPYRPNVDTKGYYRSHYGRVGIDSYFVVAPDYTRTRKIFFGENELTVLNEHVCGNTGCSSPLPEEIVYDNNQSQKTFTYRNARGQKIIVQNRAPMGDQAPIGGAVESSVEFEYDAWGNVVRTRTLGHANAVVELEYDIRGNKVRMRDPDLGTWQYKYDGLGQLIEQIDAKGQRTRMTYDRLGRMVSRTTDYQGSNPQSSAWYYDGFGENDEIGALRLEVGPDGSRRSFYYDDKGRNYLVLDKIRVGYGTDKNFKYFYRSSTYDAYGRLYTSTRHWRPLELEGSNNALHYGWLSFGIRNAYNARGFLTQVQDSEGHVWWNSPQYNVQGQLTSYQFGRGLMTTLTYDTLSHQLESIRTGDRTGDAARLQHYSLDIDPLGNVTRRQDHRRGLSETFTYDRLNRLTGVTRAGQVINVEYDKLGNIIRRSHVGAYAYDSQRVHAVVSAGGHSYDYDMNGNMIERDGSSVSWTAFNKVASISRGTNASAFTYDGNHQRLTQQMQRDGQPYRRKIYTVGIEQDESMVNGQWKTHLTRLTVPGPNGVLGTHVVKSDKTVENRFYLKDHLGSVVGVVNDQPVPELVEEYSYDAWGKRRDPTTWEAISGTPDLGSDRGYTGHEMLDLLSLVHMNGRIYDPEIGRMLSPDPIIQAVGNSQSYNRYSYTWNRPLSGTDPSGYVWGFGAIGDFGAGVVDTFVNIGSAVVDTAVNIGSSIVNGISNTVNFVTDSILPTPVVTVPELEFIEFIEPGETIGWSDSHTQGLQNTINAYESGTGAFRRGFENFGRDISRGLSSMAKTVASGVTKGAWEGTYFVYDWLTKPSEAWGRGTAFEVFDQAMEETLNIQLGRVDYAVDVMFPGGRVDPAGETIASFFAPGIPLASQASRVKKVSKVGKLLNSSSNYTVALGNHRAVATYMQVRRGLLDPNAIVGKIDELELAAGRLADLMDARRLSTMNVNSRGVGWLDEHKVKDIFDNFSYEKIFDTGRDGGVGIILREGKYIDFENVRFDYGDGEKFFEHLRNVWGIGD